MKNVLSMIGEGIKDVFVSAIKYVFSLMKYTFIATLIIILLLVIIVVRM
jgi:hypothetical protein